MKAKRIAMGGVTAALAVVIMCFGGLIPVATYICPIICCMLLQIISGVLGVKLSWVWYTAVSILVFLLGPDKEAAAIFVFLGYYPIIRPCFPAKLWGWILKLLYFNGAVFAAYAVMLWIMGLEHLAQEFAGIGAVMGTVLALLGNASFILLDRSLAMLKRRFS